MANITDPAQIDLTQTYRTDDHAEEYARRNLDQEWAAYQKRQAAEGGGPEIRGAPGQGTEAPAAPPTAETSKAPKSSFSAAIDATLAAAREGILTAVKPGPLSMESAREVVMGAVQTALAPLAGLAAGIGQEFENLAPETAGAEFLAGGVGGPAWTLRHIAMGAPAVQTLTPEQVAALSQPMSGREALEFAAQQVPFAVPGGKRVATAVKMQATELRGQRGSIGPPPEGAAFKGAPRPEAPPAAEAVPPKPGELTPPPGAEARINLARQAAPESAKQVMTAISKIISERPEVIESRRTVTHAETIAEAATWKLDRVLATEPGSITLAEVRGFQLAARDYFNAASQHLDDLAQRVLAGDAEAKAQWRTAKLTLGRLAELQEMPGTELGRALESRKIEATVARAAGYTPETIARLAELTAGADVPPEIDAARYQALPTKAQRGQFLRQSWAAVVRGKDIVHELWINNLLTNPQTHAANVLGTGMSVAWNIPETWMAEIVNRLFTRDAAGVQRGEAAALVRAIPQGLSDGIRLSARLARKDLPEVVPQWVQRRLPARAQDWITQGQEVSFSGAEHALLAKGRVEVDQQLPGIFRIPTIALGIEDAAAKGIVYRQELSALALREARNEGKIGPALEARVKELETNPPPSMLAEAVDAAMLRTLNAELGPAGQTFMQWANQVPGGRLILPFIRTPTNAAKWFGQRAPVLAQLSAQNWRDITAGGAARDKAIARQAIGAAVATVVLYEVAQGNITGSGTPDKNLRSIEREERPRNAIRVGNTWYEYSRTDPVGALIGLVAEYGELTSHIPTQDDYEQWAAYSEAIALAVGQVMVNKTYMRGLADVLEAMKDPHRNAGKIASGWARSIVPAGVRAVTRQMDDNILRDTRGILDEIKAGLPYFAEGVPAQRNPITGEAVRMPPGWGPDLLSPIYITEKRNDPVFEEILANRISLPSVPWYVGPGERAEGPMLQEPRGGQRALKLTPKQRDYWIVAMTQLATDGEGRTLHQALADLVKSDRYQAYDVGPGSGREMLIKEYYKAYMDRGQAMLRRESPTLVPKIRAAQEEKARRLLPRSDPRSPGYGKPLTLGR